MTDELTTLKNLLGITTEDTQADEVMSANLEYILNSTNDRLKNLIGGVEPPEELRHIIIDVSCIRFNRLGSEGASSHSVKDESISFVDDDFSGYMNEINAWLSDHNDTVKGKIRFL